MNVLLLDVDSLRADHLGAYGYGRATSPHLDALASRGWRFERCYVSDAPCQPSRTAFATGRFGFGTGVVAHGGRRAEPYNTSAKRIQAPDPATRHWFHALERAGWHTASVSSFASRHAAWWYLAGLNTWLNSGKDGMETADEVVDTAVDWLERHGAETPWCLHVNLWDPHTPYRAPSSGAFGNDPIPAWLTKDLITQQRDSFGPLSARDGMGLWFPDQLRFERPGVPAEIRDLADFRAWIDAYDDGVAFADAQIGRLLARLRGLGLESDTLVVLTSDHGENLGESNLYGDHQTADHATTRVPWIMAHPSLGAPRVERGLHYQFDLTATVLEMLGVGVPEAWDARSAWQDLASGRAAGRDALVLSQMAWSCQRAVRWDDWLLIRTFHPGLKNLPPLALFDVTNDPHQTSDLRLDVPAVVDEGLRHLARWMEERLAQNPEGRDPMQTVIEEGGPSLARGHEGWYEDRLRETGRAHAVAHMLESARPYEDDYPTPTPR
jgi:choline-sulfatase